MRGITRSPFANWIEKEEKTKDFNPHMLEKYEGKGDPMAYLLYFKQMMSLEVIFEALTCKMFPVCNNFFRESFVVV